MRTTLNIADDVLHAARERARRERKSLGDVVSELARESLTQRRAGQATERFFGFEPFPSRGGTVSNELIDRLREEEPD